MNRSPLFRRVLVGVIAVFALLAAAIAIGSARQIDRSLRAEFRSKGSAIASSIASSAVELMLNRDPATLQSMVDQFLDIRGVGYVFVSDDKHTIVTHTFVPGVPEPLRRLAGSRQPATDEGIVVGEVTVPGLGTFIDVSAPILAGVVGTVHVGMDTAVIAADVRAEVLQQQLTIAAVFVVSLLLAYAFVGRTARPLYTLTEYVRRIGDGGFASLAPDPRVAEMAARSRDEIGDLARAFLGMASKLRTHVEDLQHAKDALADYSQSLEQRVAERTEELEDKNLALEQALAQLTQAQQQIVTQEKLASLGALTAGIAHEIKNPLNFINNFAELSNELVTELREILGAPPSDNRAAIDDTLDLLQTNVAKINEHGRRADSIVRNMLLHSRGRTGERERVDLNALLHEDVALAYHGMRGQDPSFNAALEEDYDRSIGPIEAVPQDLSRAFLNLLANACYALREKQRQLEGDAFEPRLSVRTRSLGDIVEVRIRDNGPGVSPDVRDKMFEPFFTTKPAGSGTGLGLSITFDIIVQTHRGRIALDSVHGEFTEFIIALPRAADRASALSG